MFPRLISRLTIPSSSALLLGSTWFSRSKNQKQKQRNYKEYALEEVQQHCSEDSLWVTFKGEVFDITSFVNGHPGLKSRLIMAGGTDLEPYWDIYQDHYRGHVIPFLKKFKIGTLNNEDTKKASNQFIFGNAYDDDPVRHPDLLHNTYHPFNGECLLERLVEKYYTPNHLHYVRNHLPVPRITEEDYELDIMQGNGIKNDITLNLNDIKTKFKKYEVVSPLQCAGNRREDFHGTKKQNLNDPNGKELNDNLIFIGPHWVVGAISCAKWGGARLRDILDYAGLDVDSIALGKLKDPNGQHVHFGGYDCDETGLEYGVSIPIDKAADALGDCIIAYEMNGKPLPRDHGFPARAIVPGFAGARNCKWIHEISLHPNASMAPWHENAYRGFSPDITFEDDLYLWDDAKKVNLRPKNNNPNQPNMAPIALEQPIQSIVCYPPPNAILGGKNLDFIQVKGVAWSGGGRGVHRVDVSIDGGKNFVGSELFKPKDLRNKEIRMRQWGWYHFNVKVPIPEYIKNKIRNGETYNFDITSKGVNGDYNVQPENIEPYYNARGIQINHWYRVPIKVDGTLNKKIIIRDTESDKKDHFRNKPSGGKFRIPWENPNGSQSNPRINKNDKERKFVEEYYNYGHTNQYKGK